MGLRNALTVPQVATRVGVTIDTIRRWIAAGFLPAHKAMGSKAHRIYDYDLERCLALVRAGKTRGQLTPKRPYYVRAKARQKAAYWAKKNARDKAA